MSKQVSLDQVVQCGVEPTEAIALLPQINHHLATQTVEDCWQSLTRKLLRPTHPFALHDLLYKTTFADTDVLGAAPAWFPSPEQVAATNLAALMRDLNLATYADLYAWSIRDRAAFWQTLIQRLGIRLRQPYTQLLDLSQGAEFPQWLVDTRLNIVESCFQASPKAVAIVHQSESGCLQTWTYQDLQRLTNRVSNSLVAWGFQPGDAIAVTLPMTAESVAIYLGIIQAGGVVVAIADSFAPAEMATRLRLAHASAIFTQDVVERAGKQLPLYTKVVQAEAPRAIVLSKTVIPRVVLRSQDLPWNHFLSDETEFEAVAAPPDTPTNILFSSGTTGNPKAIPWTHTTPIKCATDGYLHQDIHPGDVVAWSTNLGWMMGPWLIYASLINRATIALYEGAPTTRHYGEFIQNARVTLLGVVPSLVNLWKTTHCMQGLDWSTIKAFSSTGECSNPQDMRFLMSLAGYKPVIEYCGGTEIGGGYLTGTLVQPCIPATFSTVALGSELVILDGQDRLADKGEGFLIPPAIGLSTQLLHQDHHRVYFADTPELGKAEGQVVEGQVVEGQVVEGQVVEGQAWLGPLRRHGDYLERLPNGYYRVGGRVDDTMNLGGIKVSTAEIERAINTVDAVGEAAAIAIAPPEQGPSQLIIYVVVAPNTEITQAELKARLQAAIAQQLNPLFKIQHLVIVDTLPRTASNKLMRRVLRDRYLASVAQPASALLA